MVGATGSAAAHAGSASARSEYVAATEWTPPTTGKATSPAPQDRRGLPVTYTRVTTRPARWWDVTIGTAGVAVLAAAIAAASVAAAVIGRSSAR